MIEAHTLAGLVLLYAAYEAGRYHGERTTLEAIRKEMPKSVPWGTSHDDVTVDGVTWKNAGRYRESHNNNNR